MAFVCDPGGQPTHGSRPDSHLYLTRGRLLQIQELFLEGAPGTVIELSQASRRGNSSILAGGSKSQFRVHLDREELTEAAEFAFQPQNGCFSEARTGCNRSRCGGSDAADPTTAVRNPNLPDLARQTIGC